MEVYAILSWLSVNASLSYLAAGPVTVLIAGRHAEVPPTAYPTQIAVARLRLRGGNCMKQGKPRGPIDHTSL